LSLYLEQKFLPINPVPPKTFIFSIFNLVLL
jgi:hypothetical protein